MYDYNDFLVPSVEEIANSSSSNFPFYVDELRSNQFDTACNQALLIGMKSEVVVGDDEYRYSPSSFLPSCNNQLSSFSKYSNSFQRSELYEYFTVSSSYVRKSQAEVLNSQLANPMRKMFSTAPGDIQVLNSTIKPFSCTAPGDIQHSDDHCTVEGTNKIIRYSAEVRKERIEKYRSKRNHRNFNKKITYACRKTLADSRPRIRGRFAKIEDTGDSSQCTTQWSPTEEDDHDAWLNFLGPSYMATWINRSTVKSD